MFGVLNMSRIGKHPISVPSGVTVSVDGQHVHAKGKLGELSAVLHGAVEAVQEDGKITVRPREMDRQGRSLWGTSRTVVANLVKGVSEGFTQRLEISGVGYRAALDGTMLNLQLGYSHDIKYAVPKEIRVVVETPTSLQISGADKQKVGQLASEIRSFRLPEPYKGKGVKYAGEAIRRKEGKKK